MKATQGLCRCGCGRSTTNRFAPGHNMKNRTEEFFWAKVDRASEGCWEWTGRRDRAGYGIYSARTLATERAHRVAYEYVIGPIPAGLVLDHLCRNKGCVNPAHLDPVTPAENTARCEIAAATINSRKTRCKRGHVLAGRNLIVNSARGKRACRTCRVLMERARRARKRSAA